MKKGLLILFIQNETKGLCSTFVAELYIDTCRLFICVHMPDQCNVGCVSESHVGTILPSKKDQYNEISVLECFYISSVHVT